MRSSHTFCTFVIVAVVSAAQAGNIAVTTSSMYDLSASTSVPTIARGESWTWSFSLTTPGGESSCSGDIIAASGVNAAGYEYVELTLTNVEFNNPSGVNPAVSVYMNVDYEISDLWSPWNGWHKLEGHGELYTGGLTATWDKGSVHNGVPLPPYSGNKGGPGYFGFDTGWNGNLTYPQGIYNIKTTTALSLNGHGYINLPGSAADYGVAPEPGSALLFAIGVAGFVLRRR